MPPRAWKAAQDGDSAPSLVCSLRRASCSLARRLLRGPASPVSPAGRHLFPAPAGEDSPGTTLSARLGPVFVRRRTWPRPRRRPQGARPRVSPLTRCFHVHVRCHPGRARQLTPLFLKQREGFNSTISRHNRVSHVDSNLGRRLCLFVKTTKLSRFASQASLRNGSVTTI